MVYYKNEQQLQVGLSACCQTVNAHHSVLKMQTLHIRDPPRAIGLCLCRAKSSRPLNYHKLIQVPSFVLY